MAANTPMVKQVAWLPIILQAVILGLIVALFTAIGGTDPFLAGLITYYILLILLRNLVAKDHRKAIRLVRRQHFGEAIPFFEKSLAFFDRNAWIDRYRFVTLLSASKLSYRDMAVSNIAFLL